MTGHGIETSLVAQMLKKLLAIQETWVWSLGRADSLKEGRATHGQRSLEGYSLWDRKESDMTVIKNHLTHLSPFPIFVLCAQSLNHIRLFAIPLAVAVRLLWPWNSPGKNTGVDCHSLLQGNFPIQGSNSGLKLQADSLPYEPPGKLLSR